MEKAKLSYLGVEFNLTRYPDDTLCPWEAEKHGLRASGQTKQEACRKLSLMIANLNQ